MTQPQPPKSLVLYADDDPDDIDLLRQAFEEHAQNVELLTFQDGKELLNYIEKLDAFQPLPCLAIIDINMPRLSGKETLKRLRAMDGFLDLPAVLFSTSTMPADAHFARNHNAGFVTKPLHSQQIHLIINQIIEHCPDEVKKMIQKRNNN
ncbi:MAG: response regulator [Flavisolibacter sp.]